MIRLLVLALALAAPQQSPLIVSEDTWEGDWPLTVTEGVLTCISMPPVQAVYLIALEDGRGWPLNGAASSHASRWGMEPSLDPVWRENVEMKEILRATVPPHPDSLAAFEREWNASPVRISVSDLIQAGLRECEG